MSYNLFLDDIRTPEMAFHYMRDIIYLDRKWIIVRTYDDFVKYIEANGMPDIVSYDHDLADEHYHDDMYKGVAVYAKLYDSFKEKTGKHCLDWLIQKCIDEKLKFPKWVLHTMNPAGKQAMQGSINTYYKYFTPETDSGTPVE